LEAFEIHHHNQNHHSKASKQTIKTLSDQIKHTLPYYSTSTITTIVTPPININNTFKNTSSTMSASHVPRYVQAEDSHRSSIVSTKSMKNGLKSLAQKYKEHDRQVQAAWEAYYGVGQAAPTKPFVSRNNSATSEESVRHESSPSNFQKAVKAVKQRAQEHHRSVNAAYASYYGDTRVYQQRAQATKQYTY
jgi:hypothetical protein